MRGATINNAMLAFSMMISIHAPHAGSDEKITDNIPSERISIHAPHAGSDKNKKDKAQESNISIHAPHAGSDHYGILGPEYIKFQSTLPMRGATPAWGATCFHAVEQGFHQACGERPPHGERHRGHSERDHLRCMRGATPAWGATCFPSRLQRPPPCMRGARERPPHGERLAETIGGSS